MEDLSKQEIELLLSVYREQTLQLLEEMGDATLRLERGEAGPEVMATLKRAAHTIKGDSACVGLGGIAEITHLLEDSLNLITQGSVSPGREMVDVILEALDVIRESVAGGEIIDVGPARVKQYSEMLQAARGQKNSTEVKVSSANKNKGVINLTGTNEGGESKPARGNRREYVRVEAAKLDALLNLAGEMVIARSSVNRLGLDIEELLPKSEVAGRFNSSSAQMGRLISELQKSVLKMRMVTMDQVFKRFGRPMRELAQESGKQIEIEMLGGETEVDRALVDLIYEPLLHLLRNAVDHGIETPSERVQGGKPEAGKITVRAFHEGNQVVVEVRDDGKGIDVEVLKKRAVEDGIYSADESRALSDEEALELIFRDGFSTAEELTKVSGRGIGTGAVRNSIEQVRGSVSLWSEKGTGTSFFLRMPLTLAIVRALLFTSSGRLLALPLLSVREVVRVMNRETRFIDGFEAYRLRNRFISLIRPGVVLGYERRSGGAGAALREGDSSSFVIVVGVAGRSFGVMADSLLGEQELVIKPLEGGWVQNESVTGASVLGDGRVVLIMDPESMFRKAIRHERSKGNGLETYAG